jgi:hypothetical protein
MNLSKELAVFLLGVSFVVCAGQPDESIIRWCNILFQLKGSA